MVYKSDPRETMAHFRTVAPAVDLPIICYNNPVSYGVDITPEMFDELADEPRFVAIKESSEDCRRITDIKNRCGDRYALFCGVDDLGVGKHHAGSGRLGIRSGECVSGGESPAVGPGHRGPLREAVELYRWFTPLLHLDTPSKAGAIHQAGDGRVRLRHRDSPAAAVAACRAGAIANLVDHPTRDRIAASGYSHAVSAAS